MEGFVASNNKGAAQNFLSQGTRHSYMYASRSFEVRSILYKRAQSCRASRQCEISETHSRSHGNIIAVVLKHHAKIHKASGGV